MESLSIGGVTLEGFAQGGIRTSIGVPEVGAIFDAGTLIPTCLRYDNVFITHGHLDHIGAITSLIGRRNLQDLPPAKLYVPKVIQEPLEVIFEKWWEINGGHGPKFPVEIAGKSIGDKIRVRRGMEVSAVRTYHRIDSIGWSVTRTTNRLKPEFVGLSGPEIGSLKKKGVEITDPHTQILLTIPGDTTIDFLIKEEAAQKAKILVHEVTIWDDVQSTAEKCKRYGHTHFRDMIKYHEKFEGEHLVLVHRSMKYSRRFIEAQAKKHFPKDLLEKVSFFDGGDKGSQHS